MSKPHRPPPPPPPPAPPPAPGETKEELEKAKLRAEIAGLTRPFYQATTFWFSAVTTVGLGGGVFLQWLASDVRRERANLEVAIANQGVEKAKQEVEKANQEVERANRELEEKKQEHDKKIADIKDANRVYEQARAREVVLDLLARRTGRAAQAGQLAQLNLGAIEATDDDLAALADHLPNLPELDGLALQGSKLTEPGLARLAKVTQLTALRLDGLPVGDAALRVLTGMPRLTRIGLGGTRVTDDGLRVLAGLRQIEEVGLAETKITPAGLDVLAGFPNLRRLDLAGVAVGDEGWGRLAGCRGLESLRMGGDQVTPRAVEHLRNLPALAELRLDTPETTNAALALIKGLTALRKVDVTNSRVTPEDADAFARGRPVAVVGVTRPGTPTAPRPDPAGPAADGFRAKLWPAGRVVRVRFLDGTDDQHKLVRGIADEWTRYANLRFDYQPAKSGGDIRVTFRGYGFYSQLGTDALSYPSGLPSMSLGLRGNEPPDEVRKSVLHEFGHALGLLHDFQNPAAGLAWDRAAVLEYSRPRFPALTDDQIMSQYQLSTAGLFAGYREFDSKSVMNYTLPIRLFRPGTGVEIQQGSELSASDRRFIRELYPFNDAVLRPRVGEAAAVALDRPGAAARLRVLVPAGKCRVELGKDDPLTLVVFGPDGVTDLLGVGDAVEGVVRAAGTIEVVVRAKEPLGTGCGEVRVTRVE